MKHNSDPILDSSGCWITQILRRIFLRTAGGSLTSNSLVWVSPLSTLLSKYFLESVLKENDCRKTPGYSTNEEDGPTHHVQSSFWLTCLRIGFCRHIWFGSWGQNWFSRMTIQEQVCWGFHPCVNLHREMLFQLLLNCVKLNSVSCTSNLLAQMFDFQLCTRPLLILILILQVLQQNQSLETIPCLQCCAVFPTWQNCLYSHVQWTYEIKRAERLSNALVHLVIARASLLTDHKMSGLPMRFKYWHVRKMCEQTFDNSPTDPTSSSLNWWSSVHGVATLYSCWVVLFANSKYLSPKFFAWPSTS